MKVSIEAIQYAYGIAKRYYAGSLSFTDAYTNISEHTGMAVNSAKDYINNLTTNHTTSTSINRKLVYCFNCSFCIIKAYFMEEALASSFS